MKNWRIFFLAGIISGGLVLAGCAKFSAQTGQRAEGERAKMQVVASFYPMYEFARQVGKDKAAVKVLVPAGVEPHDWEPTPRDMAALQEAQVFIYNGAGFEHWADKALQHNGNPALLAVETSKGLACLDIAAGSANGGEQDGKRGAHRGKDPHVWLDPLSAQHQVLMIRDAFMEADPANRTYYAANAAEYVAKLAALHEEYAAALMRARQKKFITTHAAFGYLAKRYGIEQSPVLGLAPHAEPTPERLKSLVQEVREQRLKYIFFETPVSPKVAEIIAEEAGVGTLVLNPVEGLTPDDINKGKDYIALMKENLTNLKLALEVE